MHSVLPCLFLVCSYLLLFRLTDVPKRQKRSDLGFEVRFRRWFLLFVLKGDVHCSINTRSYYLAQAFKLYLDRHPPWVTLWQHTRVRFCDLTQGEALAARPGDTFGRWQRIPGRRSTCE
jgi:hypothetical protein